MKTGVCTLGRLVSLGWFASALLLSPVQLASGASTIVTGKVLDENGAPVNEARIIAVPGRPDGGDHSAQMATTGNRCNLRPPRILVSSPA